MIVYLLNEICMRENVLSNFFRIKCSIECVHREWIFDISTLLPLSLYRLFAIWIDFKLLQTNLFVHMKFDKNVFDREEPLELQYNMWDEAYNTWYNAFHVNIYIYTFEDYYSISVDYYYLDKYLKVKPVRQTNAFSMYGNHSKPQISPFW